MEGPDIVEPSNPVGEIKKNKILVAMETDSVSFACKIDYVTEVTQTLFETSEDILLEEEPQKVEKQTFFSFLEKGGKIEHIERKLNVAWIQCYYKTQEKEARSERLTLSVWTLEVSVDKDSSKNDVTLVFKRSDGESCTDTNVLDKVQEKIIDLTKEFPLTMENGGFEVHMELKKFKSKRANNGLLKSMSSTIVDANGDKISTEHFLVGLQGDNHNDVLLNSFF